MNPLPYDNYTDLELQTTSPTSCPLLLNTPPPLTPACTAHVVCKYKDVISYFIEDNQLVIFDMKNVSRRCVVRH